jgi:3-hydroxyisobutyrate dehydrogenase-like beta-hydroxyacid dehydrogenase
MQIAIAGLGRIGAGMARRLARNGHDVIAWNRHAEVATALAAEPENGGHVTVAESLEAL